MLAFGKYNIPQTSNKYVSLDTIWLRVLNIIHNVLAIRLKMFEYQYSFFFNHTSN